MLLFIKYLKPFQAAEQNWKNISKSQEWLMAHPEDGPLITTRCRLPLSHFLIQTNSWPEIPVLSSFTIGFLWGTLSHDFEKSKYIKSREFPSSNARNCARKIYLPPQNYENKDNIYFYRLPFSKRCTSCVYKI